MIEHGWLSLLEMGGYALHVWGAYLVVPALVLMEIVLLALRRRSILGHLGWRQDELARKRACRADHLPPLP